jgi:hypothetical protein
LGDIRQSAEQAIYFFVRVVVSETDAKEASLFQRRVVRRGLALIGKGNVVEEIRRP